MDDFPNKTRRLPWIEASLRFAGQFGAAEKKAYRHRFELTDSMVSRDQDAFLRRINGRSASAFVIKECGRLRLASGTALPAVPVFSPLPTMTEWLRTMLGLHFEAIVPIRRAEPPHAILRELVQAISERRPLGFRYQPRKGGPNERLVSPHVIVDAVGRLHLRGWDHVRNAPRDFVLTRITQVTQTIGAQRFVSQEHDRDWHEQVTLEVRLREGEDRDAVRPDYDLGASDCITRKVRKAFARYLVDDGSLVRDHGLRAPVTVRPKQ